MFAWGCPRHPLTLRLPFMARPIRQAPLSSRHMREGFDTSVSLRVGNIAHLIFGLRLPRSSSANRRTARTGPCRFQPVDRNRRKVGGGADLVTWEKKRESQRPRRNTHMCSDTHPLTAGETQSRGARTRERKRARPSRKEDTRHQTLIRR